MDQNDNQNGSGTYCKKKKNCTTRAVLSVITRARFPGGLLLVSLQADTTRLTLSPLDIAVETVNRQDACRGYFA